MPSPSTLPLVSRLVGMIGRIQGPFSTTNAAIEALGKKLNAGGWAYVASPAPERYTYSVLGVAIVFAPGAQPLAPLVDHLAVLCQDPAIDAVVVLTPNAHLALPEELADKPVRRAFVGGPW